MEYKLCDICQKPEYDTIKMKYVNDNLTSDFSSDSSDGKDIDYNVCNECYKNELREQLWFNE